MPLCWYLRILPVLHIADDVGIGINTIYKKHAVYQRDYRIKSFLSIRHVHGDLCKYLRKVLSTNLDINQCLIGTQISS